MSVFKKFAPQDWINFVIGAGTLAVSFLAWHDTKQLSALEQISRDQQATNVNLAFVLNNLDSSVVRLDSQLKTQRDIDAVLISSLTVLHSQFLESKNQTGILKKTEIGQDNERVKRRLSELTSLQKLRNSLNLTFTQLQPDKTWQSEFISKENKLLREFTQHPIVADSMLLSNEAGSIMNEGEQIVANPVTLPVATMIDKRLQDYDNKLQAFFRQIDNLIKSESAQMGIKLPGYH